jgi:hypothetical protein
MRATELTELRRVEKERGPQDKLTELFDQPKTHSPFKVWGDHSEYLISWFYVADMTYVLVAKRKYGSVYSINFKMIKALPDEETLQTDPYGDDAWEEIYRKIYQAQGNITGTGHQTAVISTIVKIFKEFVQKINPSKIEFSAFSSSRGRILLYRRLASLAAKELKFQVSEDDLGGVGKFWTLTK